MDENNEKLLKALDTIREECRKYSKCNDCPLRTKKDTCCIIDNNPDEWKFKNDEDEPKRLFL